LLKKAAASFGKDGVKLAFQVSDADLVRDFLKVVFVNANESWLKISHESGQWVPDFGNELEKELANAFDCLCVEDDKVRNVLCGKVNSEEEHTLFAFDPDGLAIDAAKAAPSGRKFGGNFLGGLAVFSQLMKEGKHSAMIDLGF
jgi:hypothetical protein